MVITYDFDVFSGKEAKLCSCEWSDLEMLLDNMEGHSLEYMRGKGSRDTSWLGGTFKDMKDYIDRGCRKGIDDLQEMVDKLITAIPFETLGRDLSPSVTGYRPIIPAYLAGRPDSMLGIEDGDTPEGLLRLYVDPIGICSTTVPQLRKRGAAVVALLEAIQMFRPVELYVYSCGGSWVTQFHSCIKVRMGVTPLDISEVIAAIVEPVVARLLFLTKQQELIGDDDHHEAFPRPSIPEHQIVYATEEDIVIPSIWNPETDDVLNKPAEWVKARLEEALLGEGMAFEGV